MAIGWRQPLRELDTGQDVVEAPVLRLAATDKDGRHDSQDDEHLDWNITDQTILRPYGECRYVVELASRQMVVIDLISTNPVEIAVCSDDDYDRFLDGTSCNARCFLSDLTSERTSCQITFRPHSNGLYDVIVCNPEGKHVDFVLRIIATRIGKPPARESLPLNEPRLP